MYMTPTNNPEPHSPVRRSIRSVRLRGPAPFRINVLKSLRLHPVASLLVRFWCWAWAWRSLPHKPYYGAASIIYVSPTFPRRW
jgi:hypothetical protein